MSTRGLESRGREAIAAYVQAGGGVLLASGPQLDPRGGLGHFAGTLTMTAPETDARSASRSLAPGDVRHPILEAFAGARSAARHRHVPAHWPHRRGGCHVLARFSTGEPAFVDCTRGPGRVIAIASDLDNAWNDFPLHASFVPFIHEAVRYLGGGDPGAAIIWSAMCLPACRPCQASRPSPPVLRVAVNVDPAESAVERLTAAEFEAPITRVKQGPAGRADREVQQQEERQHVWQYVLGLMVAMLVVESFIGSRTS